MYKYNAIINPVEPGYWWTLPPGGVMLGLRIDRITEIDIRWMNANYPEGNGHKWWGPIPEPEVK